MKLESKRLLLREVTQKDIKNMHLLHLESEVAAYNTIGIPKDLNETENLFKPIFDQQGNEGQRIYSMVIENKDTGEFIGEFGIRLSVEKYSSAEIYYNLLPKHWRKGFAYESCMAVLDHGFNELNLHRIEAGVATANEKSYRLLEKIGMSKEGLHRKILPIRGQWQDNYHYAILEEDYFQ